MQKNAIAVSSSASLPDIQPTPAVLIEYFQILQEREDPVLQAWDIFNDPIEVFAPDGTLIFLNREMISLHKITDTSLLIGKYNVLQDKKCMDEMGYREKIEEAFSGLKVFIDDFPAPINDVYERGAIDEIPFEAAIMDLCLYPVKRKGTLLFVICYYKVRSLYYGRPDVARAKEYIDSHWQEEYDSEAAARHVGMSVKQLYNIFNKHVGMPPGEYYRKYKVKRIMEKLLETNLTVAQAFAACGEDSRGAFARVFKKTAGVSPTEFRKQNSM